MPSSSIALKPAPEPGNPSGLRPINANVLIRPDEVSETLGTSGKLVKPDSVKDRDQHAQTVGRLVATCPDAFEGMASPPEIGARVCFARYAGTKVKGPKDGETYLLMKDVDITGIED